jgi:hypothetical protein
MAAQMLAAANILPPLMYNVSGSEPMQMVRVRGSGVGVRVAVLSGVEVLALKVEVGVTVLVVVGRVVLVGDERAHAKSETRLTRSRIIPDRHRERRRLIFSSSEAIPKMASWLNNTLYFTKSQELEYIIPEKPIA